MSDSKSKNGEKRPESYAQQLSLDFSERRQSAKVLPFSGSVGPNAEVVALRKLLEAAKRLPG